MVRAEGAGARNGPVREVALWASVPWSRGLTCSVGSSSAWYMYCILLFYLTLPFKIFIGVELIYSVVLASAKRQSEALLKTF